MPLIKQLTEAALEGEIDSSSKEMGSDWNPAERGMPSFTLPDYPRPAMDFSDRPHPQ